MLEQTDIRNKKQIVQRKSVVSQLQQQLAQMEESMKDLQGQNETLERQVVQSGIQEKINDGTRQINKELDNTRVEQQKLRDGMKNVVDLTRKELALEKKNNSVDNKEK